MKVAGIIAEFNPFHFGHKYLIDKCRQELGADKIVVVMSGDFVQRGAPAIIDKFTRTKMALECGADLVIELPVYYSLGSAEFFAKGAVGILDGLGCVDHLFFGAENPDIEKMDIIADILNRNPVEYSDLLNRRLKEGKSFAASRAGALTEILGDRFKNEAASSSQSSMPVSDADECEELLSLPNNILAIEYLRALKERESRIKPCSVRRTGAGYHSLEDAEIMSASKVRSRILSFESSYIKEKAFDLLKGSVPDEIIPLISDYKGIFPDSDNLSGLLHYKLLLERHKGYTEYLDVSRDLSNRIINNLEDYECFTTFCKLLKTKNLAYTRISRSLIHILLNITNERMDCYRSDNFTGYARILGMKTSASDLLSRIHESSSIPVIERLKTAEKLLSSLQLQLLDETLTAGRIYNSLAQTKIPSEFRLKPVFV